MITNSAGEPVELREGMTYTIQATVPTGDTLTDAGITAAQVRQALERADSLGITLHQIIEEPPLMSEADMIRAFRSGGLR